MTIPSVTLTVIMMTMAGADPPREDRCVRYTANLSDSSVAAHDCVSGEFLGQFVEPGANGLHGATGLAVSSAGDVFVASSQTHAVLRYNADGEFLGEFARTPELVGPFSLIFGPDNDLYVSSSQTKNVLRFDGETGKLHGVAAEGGGLEMPIGLAFDAEGLLYVANARGNNVLRFNPEDGSCLGVAAEHKDLRFPSDVVFDAEGRMFVSSPFNGRVFSFDPKTGRSEGVVCQLPEGSVPMGLGFDSNGALLVGDFGAGRLYRAKAGEEPKLITEEGFDGPENFGCRQHNGVQTPPASMKPNPQTPKLPE